MKNSVAQILRLLSILFISWLLIACGPNMSTVTDYYPPASDSGLRCVSRANQDRDSCNDNNKKRLVQCQENAAYEAEEAYSEAKNTYTIALENYIWEDERYDRNYAHYEKQKQLLIQEGELQYIRCSDDVKMQQIKKFPTCEKLLKIALMKADKLHPPTAPERPYAPDKNLIYKRLKAKCNNLIINCEQNFNQAYIACGGNITNRQVCVSNCD